MMDGRAWRRALLSASLILNVFLLALVGGHMLRTGAMPGEASMLARALSAAEHSLGTKDAAVFRQTLHDEAPAYEAAAEALAHSRAALGDQIVAPHFDPAATRRALMAWRADWLRFTDAFSGPLIDALGRISPEGRQRLVAERRRDAPPLKAP